MKTDKDWEARARDLAYPCASDECYVRAALQLGREMADARADEIARLTMEEAMREPAKVMVFHDEAAIRADEREKIAQQIELVRATVTKPKMDLAAWCERVISAHRAGDASGARHALRQAQACADSPNPKTREQVLEEALRNIVKRGDDERARSNQFVMWDNNGPYMVAKRALEWKP